MEKIAVKCPTKEEWDEVRERSNSSFDLEFDDFINRIDGKAPMLDITNGGWNRDDGYYERKGYTIITAAEYLGGKDVKEFSVGDRVECIKNFLAISKGETFTVDAISQEGNLGFVDFVAYYDCMHFKYATKPKTTKENNMELNSSIRTVFVEEDKAAFDLVEKMQKVFGGEIAQDFTGAMILRDNKPKYIAEIKRLDDIEAKRLKEEAKK